MKYLLGQTRLYFAQCVFNTSCHYAAYNRYDKLRNKRHNTALTISGLSIVVICLTIIGWETNCRTLLSTLSFVGIILTATSMIFELYNKEDLTEIMCHHKQVAEDYKRLRDSLIDLIRQIKSGKDVSIIETSLKECLHDYSILGQYSMPTNQKDYQNAQQNLGLTGDSETFTWTPEEIDRLLPHELRG